MSLSAAFNIISSSFAANAAQTAVVSSNIANVNTPGYSREIANVVTNSYGGADVASVTRDRQRGAGRAGCDLDRAGGRAAGDRRRACDARRRRSATARRLPRRRARTRTAPRLRRCSPICKSALTTYAAFAEVLLGGGRRRDRGRQTLAASLNSGAAAVDEVREQADQDMASSVATINSLLSQFTAANNAVVSGLASGANVASAQDQRDLIVTQLSQQIGVSTIDRRQRLDVDLYRQRRRRCSRNAAHGRLHADADARRRRQRFAGHGRRRADHRPELADADPVGRARGLRRRCATRSRRNTRPSSTRSPAGSSTPSPRATSRRRRRCPRCRVSSPRRASSPALDGGGDRPRRGDRSQSQRRPVARAATRRLLRDGGVSGPGNPAYTYNSTGAASYTGRIQQLAAAIGATQSFDPSAGLRLLGEPRRITPMPRSAGCRARTAGEQRLVLSDRARDPGGLGAVERDRGQSRRRNDQHAEPRELLRLVGEAADDRQQHVLRPPQRRMTMSANSRLEPVSWPTASSCR